MTTLPQNQEKCLCLCFGFTDTAEHYQFFYSDPLSCFSLFSISSSIDISLRSRRLEVVGERENGRARGRHARGD